MRLPASTNHPRGTVVTTADRRRAGRLMKDAKAQALELLNHPELTARQRAMRSFVFVEEVARLTPKAYSAAEKQRVLNGALRAQAQFGDVG